MNSLVKAPDHVVIVGCGDIGQRTAALWQADGVPVTGIVKSDASAERLRAANINVLQVDLDDISSLQLPQASNLLMYYYAPPPTKGNEDTRMSAFLARVGDSPVKPARLVYISTSGVYGNQQGDVVTEETPLNPSVDRARRRYDAEQQLRTFCDANAIDLVILRVGGIYGPGRLPVKRIEDRVPMLFEELSPSTNRIHADDLAQVCKAAAERGRAGEVYNVSDGTDSNMTEYFNTIADYLNLPRPPLVGWKEAEQTISAGMLSYLKESRRMSNEKMLDELGVKLKYPTLLDGLPSCSAKPKA